MLSLSLWCTALAACEMPKPSAFGRQCNADGDCGELVCDVARSMCLPAPPPDRSGRSCDEPRALTFKPGGFLASGSATFTFPAAEDSAALGVCGNGRSFVFRLDVPQQTGAGGAPRAGMVLRVRAEAAIPVSLALADSNCAVADPTQCAQADALGGTELLVPLVTPGEHRLVVSSAAIDAAGAEVLVTVEQVACPAGFVPDGGGCLGITTAAGVAPRTLHTVEVLDSGAVVVIGGLGADDLPIESYDILTSTSVATIPLGSGLVEAAAAQLPSSGVIVVGGQTDTDGSNAYVLYFPPGESMPLWRQVFGENGDVRGHARGCVAGAPEADTVLVMCPGYVPTLVSELFVLGGIPCDDDYDCAGDEICVARLDDDVVSGGTCICNRANCFNGIDDFIAEDLPESRDDLPDSGGFILPQIAPGRVLVGGGLTRSGAAASTYFFSSGDFGFLTVPPALEELPQRIGAAVVAVGDEAVQVGGKTTDGTPSASVSVFAPLGSTPPRSLSLRVARTRHAVALLDDGRVLVAGGDSGAGPVATTEIVDARSNTVTTGPLLPLPLAGARAVTAPTGTFIVAGESTSGARSGAVLKTVRVAQSLDPPETQLIPPVDGDTCDLPYDLELPAAVEGTTFGKYDQMSAYRIGCAGGFSSRANEAVYRVTVPPGERLRASATVLGAADLTLFVVSSCDEDVAGACLALGDSDASVSAQTEDVEVPPAAVERTLFIVVDGYSTRQFDFRLEASLAP